MNIHEGYYSIEFYKRVWNIWNIFDVLFSPTFGYFCIEKIECCNHRMFYGTVSILFSVLFEHYNICNKALYFRLLKACS